MIVEPLYNERQKSFIILRELSKKNFLLFSLLNTSSTEYYTNDTKNFQNIQIALLIKPYRKREMKLYFRKKKKNIATLTPNKHEFKIRIFGLSEFICKI